MPVAFVTGGDAQDSIGQMRSNLEFVAAGDRQAGRGRRAARRVRRQARRRQGQARRQAPGQSFVFADAYVEGSQVSIRPYAKGSLLSDVTEQLGLVNAWTEPGDEVYGLAEADVEGLTAVGDADHFLYIANAADGGDPYVTSWPTTRCGRRCRSCRRATCTACPTASGCSVARPRWTQYVDALVAALGS